MVKFGLSEDIKALIPRPIKFVEASSSLKRQTSPINATTNKLKLNQLWEWNSNFQIKCGFQNSGSSCYLNTVLQCLLYTTPFYNFLVSRKHLKQCHNPGFCYLCYFSTIALRVTNNTLIFPKLFIANIRGINKTFRAHEEQDAHEFLLCFLDKLDQNYSPSLTNKTTDIDTIIKSIFQGTTTSHILCTNCKKISTSEEPFFALSLDINRVKRLEDAINFYFSTQKLFDEQNLYFCDRCEKKVKAKKKLCLHKPPNILTIHLKRFSSNGVFGNFCKNSDHIVYNEFLDMTNFFSKKSSFKKGNNNYQLYGVIAHLGSFLNTGHYVCYVKGPSGQWFFIDDDKVSKTAFNNFSREPAYILFYKRIQSVEEDGCDTHKNHNNGHNNGNPKDSDLTINHQKSSIRMDNSFAIKMPKTMANKIVKKPKNLIAKNKESKKHKEPKEHKEPAVIVKNLNFQATEKDLKDFFRCCGEIDKIRIIYDRKRRRSKGFCFVCFKDLLSAKKAVKMTGKRLLGRPVKVDYMKSKFDLK